MFHALPLTDDEIERAEREREDNMKGLAIIIPAFNRPAELWRCLNNLQQFRGRPGVHLHVTDDCSDLYDIFQLARKDLFGCEVRGSLERLGFAANCNSGVRFLDPAARDVEFLLFLNQDVYACLPQSVELVNAIYREFDDPEVGVVGLALVFDHDSDSVQSLGGTLDAACQPCHIGMGYSMAAVEERLRDGHDVVWTTGAAFAVRRSCSKIWAALMRNTRAATSRMWISACGRAMRATGRAAPRGRYSSTPWAPPAPAAICARMPRCSTGAGLRAAR